ncbi:TolC family protein [Testudinibacter sp. TR-2022]|uniref:toxin/drug exporter TdeA n=1 Tax=Testudinibacter sp. TR-2022 TaxID=2585029 RepID=UPI001117E89B|nr:TolC family protein [Testudinibacter sp. TR-2022]TNH00505.1 TolC family protein [Pasteurellaceae bacterium Phil31]TNH07609.1 TolC family protein [Testudinibacter sp. TR-2022]TNH10616.1 TolC family protein [Testudinibacter sp. TR-2022]TNH11952.1 TolC family protein [Testudinibacter sp. TR-2022]TNH17023.1 TolC family protein [Testudinibacter sp. TR-2022]
MISTTFFRRSATALLVGGLLTACVSNEQQIGYQQQMQQFGQYQALTAQYHIDPSWWTQYQDAQLNRLVDSALANNLDLAKAAVSVNRALYNANLLGADLVPTFGGSVSGGVQKNTESGVSSRSYSSSLSLNYTLDLWRKLVDSADAAEWEHRATEADLEAVKLTLINQVIDSYYQIAYLKQAIGMVQSNIKTYQQIATLTQNQVNQGVSLQLDADQSRQAVLSAENQLITYQSQLQTVESTLRNLLNLAPQQNLRLSAVNLKTLKLQPVNLDIPLSTIANRPDLKAYQYRLTSAFKNLSAMEKSWYPSITLGASLATSSNSVGNMFEAPLSSGTIGINLPFLDWNRVKWNVKLSEAMYETAKLNFQQGITTALNEIDSNYKAYQLAQKNMQNLDQKYRYDRNISNTYRLQYHAGVTAMKDWLTALATEQNTELNSLQAKYDLLRYQNAIYQSMAGKYQP